MMLTVLSMFISLIFNYYSVVQMLTKGAENEWGSGKRQKIESGSGNERVKELCLLNLSKK